MALSFSAWMEDLLAAFGGQKTHEDRAVISEPLESEQVEEILEPAFA